MSAYCASVVKGPVDSDPEMPEASAIPGPESEQEAMVGAFHVIRVLPLYGSDVLSAESERSGAVTVSVFEQVPVPVAPVNCPV